MWWKYLLSMHRGVGLGVGNWFDENLGRVVGDGVNSCFFFGMDVWLVEAHCVTDPDISLI